MKLELHAPTSSPPPPAAPPPSSSSSSEAEDKEANESVALLPLGRHDRPLSTEASASIEIRDDEEADSPSLAACRICLESDCDPGDQLISPCMCKGTQQFVHRSCLDHWRSVKNLG